MEQLLLENEVKVGDVVEAEVIAINGKELVLDIKQFAEGHMYINEYAANLDSFEGVLSVGDKFECVVMKISENDSHSAIYLSRLPLIKKENNEKMNSLCDANDVIEVKFTKNVGRGLVGYYLGNEENPYVCLMMAKSTDITSIEIHPDTRIIHGSALIHCTMLTEINIPSNVIAINAYAFTDCTSITEITFPNSVVFLDQNVVSDCSSLQTVKLPNSITIIDQEVFKNCSSLTTIYIPSTVTQITGSAFSYEPTITKVYFGGTMQEWEALIVNHTNVFANAEVVFEYEM